MVRKLGNLKSALLLGAIVLACIVRGGDARAADPQTALLAGGCFWCTEADFEKLPGVIGAVSGFAGGDVENPTYRQVVRGGTGHIETVLVTFDPAVVSYREIADTFLRSIDPLDAGGQFCDRGHTYSPAIFALDADQARIAGNALRDAADALGLPETKVALREAAPFYEAEDYHQDYYKSQDLILTRFGPQTKAAAYAKYRAACGRDARLREVWGDDAFTG
jgi:peptide-methionine (S)-S-oxide reductase